MDKLTCSYCDKVCKSRVGLISHQRKCKREADAIMDQTNIEKVKNIPDLQLEHTGLKPKKPSFEGELDMVIKQLWSRIKDGDIRRMILDYKGSKMPVQQMLTELRDNMSDGDNIALINSYLIRYE